MTVRGTKARKAKEAARLHKEGAQVRALQIGQSIRVVRPGLPNLDALVSTAPKFFPGIGWRFWATGGKAPLKPEDLKWFDPNYTRPKKGRVKR